MKNIFTPGPSSVPGSEDLRKYALILAGGSGLRMGYPLPKQFIDLAGKPLLIHTLENFASFDTQIDIVLVLPSEHADLWQQLCIKHNCKIPHRIAFGGKERFYSVQNGLELIQTDGIVFIHDAVRPLVSHQTLGRCFETARLTGNALPVISVSESVRFVENETSHSIDRSKIMLVQTPQTFRVSLIKEAYRQSFDAKFTDDASVLENTGHTIHLTEGNRENIKITWPSDLIWAESFLASL
jgi:2-C-methyl-D-erythritol 4-phosphate cytidylyltransferase